MTLKKVSMTLKVSAKELMNELDLMITNAVNRRRGPKWVDAEYKIERARRCKLENIMPHIKV